jgi:L-amino acid N-acyltransferase
MEITIRKAVRNDLESINTIYHYYVLNSTCTYQTEIETIAGRIEWFEKHNDDYPVIVALSGKELVGWASLSRFHTRAAYKPTVENSIYIKDECRNNGIGKLLLDELIKKACELNYHSIIAGISGDQEASIVLHSKKGFKKVAHLSEVGFKFNKWLDVIYMQLILE